MRSVPALPKLPDIYNTHYKKAPLRRCLTGGQWRSGTKGCVPGDSKWLTPFAKTKAREHGTFALLGDLDGQEMASPQRRTSNMSVDVKYIGMDVHKEADCHRGHE